MSATQETATKAFNNHSRKERTELFQKIMKPINANRSQNKKMINCGYVSLRLNELLHNLTALSLKQESQLNIESVSVGNAGQWFFYDPTHKRTRIENMNTDNKSLLDRCALETVDLKLIIDLTKSAPGQSKSKPMINLTLDDKTETDILFLEAATYSNIVDKLKALPRRSEDNTAFGFLLYAHQNANGKIGKNLHVANFFVDSNSEVYFLDAQPENLYISEKPLPDPIQDIFYIRSSAPLLVEKLSPSTKVAVSSISSDINTKLNKNPCQRYFRQSQLHLQHQLLQPQQVLMFL